MLEYSRQPKNYKELFDLNPELYVSIEVEDQGLDILKERMPFGKYQDMLFIELIRQDVDYFQYMKNRIFSESVSKSSSACDKRVRLLRVMISVERYYIIERYGESYGREYPASSCRNATNSAISAAY